MITIQCCNIYHLYIEKWLRFNIINKIEFRFGFADIIVIKTPNIEVLLHKKLNDIF